MDAHTDTRTCMYTYALSRTHTPRLAHQCVCPGAGAAPATPRVPREAAPRGPAAPPHCWQQQEAALGSAGNKASAPQPRTVLSCPPLAREQGCQDGLHRCGGTAVMALHGDTGTGTAPTPCALPGQRDCHAGRPQCGCRGRRCPAFCGGGLGDRPSHAWLRSERLQPPLACREPKASLPLPPLGGQQSWRAWMDFNPASLAGGSCIPLSLCPSSPLSLPPSLLPVSPIPVQRRFPGWARRWGRPFHSGLGGGPGAARFPPRLSKLLISPHLAAAAGPRQGGRGHCAQECLSVPPAGRAPPAAPPTMRRHSQDEPAPTPWWVPCPRPRPPATPGGVGTGTGFAAVVGVVAHVAWLPRLPAAPVPGMPPAAGCPRPGPLRVGVLGPGMGCRGLGCQRGPRTPPWPQLGAGSRRGMPASTAGVVRQDG